MSIYNNIGEFVGRTFAELTAIVLGVIIGSKLILKYKRKKQSEEN